MDVFSFEVFIPEIYLAHLEFGGHGKNKIVQCAK
jgi:hypothetical protein